MMAEVPGIDLLPQSSALRQMSPFYDHEAAGTCSCNNVEQLTTLAANVQDVEGFSFIRFLDGCSS